MSFGSFDSGGMTQPMAEINTTPLVDVMLVLLVMLIITIPIQLHSVGLEMPGVAASNGESAKAISIICCWLPKPFCGRMEMTASGGRRLKAFSHSSTNFWMRNSRSDSAFTLSASCSELCKMPNTAPTSSARMSNTMDISSNVKPRMDGRDTGLMTQTCMVSRWSMSRQRLPPC